MERDNEQDLRDLVTEGYLKTEEESGFGERKRIEDPKLCIRKFKEEVRRMKRT